MTASQNGAPEWLVDLLYGGHGELVVALFVLALIAVVVLAREAEWDAELVGDWADMLGPAAFMGLPAYALSQMQAQYELAVGASVVLGGAAWLLARARVRSAAMEAYEGNGEDGRKPAVECD